MGIVHTLYKMSYDVAKAEQARREEEEKIKAMQHKGQKSYNNPGGIPPRMPNYRSPIDEAAYQHQLRNSQAANNQSISPAAMEELMDELE